jgi:hypothetical protein
MKLDPGEPNDRSILIVYPLAIMPVQLVRTSRHGFIWQKKKIMKAPFRKL